ncbi:sigma-70 family RNA polymerase sigma factor [Humisphaera borealis]|uniref:Sigma-70 family RNA polymerase sigma factor n=1 Tax=Humisphaera borealis TaxID=2807512 RepID=A0A7M2X2E7_9BACT|nr:sigma-70 family RNA polymerase sigma factor [Humisphaera borealis]QOV91231.1 sigma-70 family RNA polymerase sigma factor [Humisphaera borealis]
MDEQTRQATRLWTAAQPLVSAFVTSVVRDFSARQDVLQDIAVAVIESFDRYDPSRPFIGWALGIAHNQVRLYFRRTRRDRLVFDDDTVATLATTFEETSPAQVQSLDYLKDCIGKLDRRSRDLCDLRYVQDLKPASIAERTGVASNTVAKALQRVRDQLRECIERKVAREGGVA